MPAGQATSADTSNVVAIANAVYDIALNKSGLVWEASQQWEFPTGKVLVDTGFPYLVVTCPDFSAFTQDAEGGSKELIREMGLTEPSWNINVFGIFPYEAGNSNSWVTPLEYLAVLLNTFTIYWGLELTCSHGNPAEPKVRKITTRDSHTFMECMLTIRAYEALNYNP